MIPISHAAERFSCSFLLYCLLTWPVVAMAQTGVSSDAAGASSASIDESLTGVFAPEGNLRTAINLGNPVLASLDAQTGVPVGLSVDLAQELARRLGVGLQLVVVPTAAAAVDQVVQGQADIGFFAIDPLRGEQISFTGPYVLIEGFYAVRTESKITSNAEVDRPGVSVAVGKGSAYDLFLSRELKQASIVRVPTSPAVVPSFLDQHLTVAAGVRQQLERDAARLGGLRILDHRFMVIRQAMGVPKSRGEVASRYLSTFVEQMKASGFVAASLARHQIDGAIVAGPND